MRKHASDFLVFMGLLTVGAGLYWIYMPACLLFWGAAMTAVGLRMRD